MNKGGRSMVKKDFHCVSFSGGKDSTAMLLHMLELGMKIDLVLYCDTWMEFPAMYRHIEYVKKIVEDSGIEFVTLKNPQSFKYLMLEHQPNRKQSTIEKLGGNPKGYSWPESKYRWCTGILKTKLIESYEKELNEKYNVIEYVGLASDEEYRLQRVNNKFQEHPLVDWGWDEKTCLKYCYDQGIDWEGLYKIFDRVSCWCCPFKSMAEHRKLKEHFPELWEELKGMDKATWRKFRSDYSVEELEIRFDLEDERLAQGLSISGHNKDFREALKKRLKGFE